MRCMRCTRGKVGKKWLIGHQRLLLVDPPDRLIGEILGEVIALFGGLGRIDWVRPLIKSRVVLVRLTSNKTVEIFKPDVAGGPGVEGTHGGRQIGSYLMALAEVGR